MTCYQSEISNTFFELKPCVCTAALVQQHVVFFILLFSLHITIFKCYIMQRFNEFLNWPEMWRCKVMQTTVYINSLLSSNVPICRVSVLVDLRCDDVKNYQQQQLQSNQMYNPPKALSRNYGHDIRQQQTIHAVNPFNSDQCELVIKSNQVGVVWSGPINWRTLLAEMFFNWSDL